MNQRGQLLDAIAGRIISRPAERVLFIGIDGVDGAGKSVFGDELAQILRARERPIIRASVDSFHNPRAIRYRRGRQSPEGFFLDSFNYPDLKRTLLDPLRAGAPYRTKIHDLVSDKTVSESPQRALPGSILVFDGIFLHRPELCAYWEFSIFLHVDFEISVARGALRDNSPPDMNAPENRRYVEGQRHYLRECDPSSHATVTVDNNDLSAPRIVIDGVPRNMAESPFRA